MPAGGALVNRSSAYSYDPQTNTWSTLRALHRGQRGASAVAIDDRSILLFWRYTVVYDIATDTSKPAAPMPVAVLVTMSGRTLYGVGGEDRMRGRTARFWEAHLTEPAL